MLSRDDILNASDITTREVDVPEWGGQVMVRTMTGRERDQWEDEVGPGGAFRKEGFVRASLCARCIVGEDGERLFSDKDILALGRKSAAALDRIYSVAADLSKVSEDDITELEGN